MTLNEKFELSINYQLTFGLVGVYQVKRAASNVEKIADDYAIEFLDWCSSKEALDILVKLIDSKELDRNPTGKDLIEIFKKEKGL